MKKSEGLKCIVFALLQIEAKVLGCALSKWCDHWGVQRWNRPKSSASIEYSKSYSIPTPSNFNSAAQTVPRRHSKYRQNNSTGSTLFDSSKQQANCGTVDRWISKDLAVVYLSRGYTIPNILSRTEQDDPVVQIDGKSFPACPFFSRRGNSRRDYDLQMACSLYPYGSCHLVCVFAKFWWNSLK